VNISPSPITAAATGAFSALALPLLRNWFGGDAGLSIPFLIALVLTVALPAHAFVVGFQGGVAPGTRSLDTALLKRIGAWLGAAAVVTALRMAF
jgi:hypothetical protein